MADIRTILYNTFNLILWSDIIDVIIVTFLIYYVLTIIKDTSAGQVVKAVIIIIVCSQVTSLLEFNVMSYLFDSIIQIGAIALIVVFQPELRKILTRLGSSKAKELFTIDKDSGSNRFQGYMEIILKSVYDLAATKTGVLLVFERNTNLGEVSQTGTIIDASLSIELIKNLFYTKAPLHDGAVIVRDFRVHAAGCVLPLSKNANLSKDLGTRHKAAIGMSEESDAVVVIVSEETGTVSCAVGGMLKRHIARDTLEKLLTVELTPSISQVKKLLFKSPGKKSAKGEGNK